MNEMEERRASRMVAAKPCPESSVCGMCTTQDTCPYNNAFKNTDKEIWREENKDATDPDNFYSPSVHVTEKGEIGITVNSCTIVRTVEQWHELVSLEENIRKAWHEASATSDDNFRQVMKLTRDLAAAEDELEHVTGLKGLRNKRLTIMHKQLEEAKALHIGHLKDCKERIELLRHALDVDMSAKDADVYLKAIKRAYDIVYGFLQKKGKHPQPTSIHGKSCRCNRCKANEFARSQQV